MPYRIRMFAEIGCDWALWGDLDEELPDDIPEEPGYVEHRLPISPDLRDQLLAWADQHYRYDGGDRQIDMSDFDRRGMLLSRSPKRELGPSYTVRYLFTFEGGRRLLDTVADDPCPGWSAR